MSNATTGARASGPRLWAALLAAGLLLIWAASLSYHLSPRSDLALMAALTWPRLLLLAGAGATLGLHGALRAALRARPERELHIFAVSLGAALVAGRILDHGGGALWIALGAVAGGLGGVLGAWSLTRRNRLLVIPMGLSLLAGAYGMLYAAGSARASVGAPRAVLLWLLGDASHAGWVGASLVAAAGFALTLRAAWLVRELDALPAVSSPGPARTRLASLSLVCWGVSVGAVGPVAFVALFAPLLARAIAGARLPSQALMLSALSGGVCLVMLDAVAHGLAGGLAYPLNMEALMVFGPAFLWLWGRHLHGQGAAPAGRWPGVLNGAFAILFGLLAFAVLAYVWSLKRAFN